MIVIGPASGAWIAKRRPLNFFALLGAGNTRLRLSSLAGLVMTMGAWYCVFLVLIGFLRHPILAFIEWRQTLGISCYLS